MCCIILVVPNGTAVPLCGGCVMRPAFGPTGAHDEYCMISVSNSSGARNNSAARAWNDLECQVSLRPTRAPRSRLTPNPSTATQARLGVTRPCSFRLARRPASLVCRAPLRPATPSTVLCWEARRYQAHVFATYSLLYYHHHHHLHHHYHRLCGLNNSGERLSIWPVKHRSDHENCHYRSALPQCLAH
jgi:hypothetical protein